MHWMDPRLCLQHPYRLGRWDAPRGRIQMPFSCWTVAIRIVGPFPRFVSNVGRPCALDGCASVCGFPGFRCAVCIPRPWVTTFLFSLPGHHVGVEPPPPPLPWMGMDPAHVVSFTPHGFSCMGWMSLPNIRWLGTVGAVDPPGWDLVLLPFPFRDDPIDALETPIRVGSKGTLRKEERKDRNEP